LLKKKTYNKRKREKGLQMKFRIRERIQGLFEGVVLMLVCFIGVFILLAFALICPIAGLVIPDVLEDWKK